jgi:hypothetical protein
MSRCCGSRLGSLLLALVAIPPGLSAQVRPEVADTLLVGCAGGLRGDGSGVAVTGDGALLEWSLRGWTGPDDHYRLIRRDPAGAAAALAAAAAVESQEKAPVYPDAVICFMHLRAKAGAREVSWSPREPPPPVLPLLDMLAHVTGADPHSPWLRRTS